MKPIETRTGRHVFEKNLTPVGIDKLTFNPRRRRPRVHLSRASYCFEREALRQVANRHTMEACELLVDAINHDCYYKSKLGRRPSIRLYDLLAGIAVRYNHPEKLSEMMQIIQKDRGESAFELRLKKWENPQSKWYRHWQDKSKEVVWKWTENGTTRKEDAKSLVVF